MPLGPNPNLHCFTESQKQKPLHPRPLWQPFRLLFNHTITIEYSSASFLTVCAICLLPQIY